jgi:hypothetical protein
LISLLPYALNIPWQLNAVSSTWVIICMRVSESMMKYSKMADVQHLPGDKIHDGIAAWNCCYSPYAEHLWQDQQASRIVQRELRTFWQDIMCILLKAKDNLVCRILGIYFTPCECEWTDGCSIQMRRKKHASHNYSNKYAVAEFNIKAALDNNPWQHSNSQNDRLLQPTPFCKQYFFPLF